MLKQVQHDKLMDGWGEWLLLGEAMSWLEKVGEGIGRIKKAPR